MNEKIVDVNVSLGNWPFQELLPKEAGALLAHLESEKISEAWVSCADSILFPDPDVHDARLFGELKPYPALRPVKTLNPMLANWDDSLRRGVEEWGAGAVKVYLNYHCFSSRVGGHYRVHRLVEAVADYGIPLMFQMRVEDERNQYPLMKVPGLSPGQITQLADCFPEAVLIALCPQQGEIGALAPSENVYVDISFADGIDALSLVLEKMPAGRVLFGSHTPFFYTRAARMKLDRAEISVAQKQEIAGGNAGRLLS